MVSSLNALKTLTLMVHRGSVVCVCVRACVCVCVCVCVCFPSFFLERKKSETRMTASVLKQDPNT